MNPTVNPSEFVPREPWPAEGPSRAPYWTFVDPATYEREQQRIFRGSAWHFLGLDAEVPDRPVVLRATDYHTVWANSEAMRRAGDTRDTPQPGRGQVLIRVAATSINARDRGIVGGFFPVGTRKASIPLSEGAGEVRARAAARHPRPSRRLRRRLL